MSPNNILYTKIVSSFCHLIKAFACVDIECEARKVNVHYISVSFDGKARIHPAASREMSLTTHGHAGHSI